LSQATPNDEFLQAVMNAAEACARFGETLIQTNDPMKRAGVRTGIYMEYAVLFVTIGLREARKLRVPQNDQRQLTRLCFDTLSQKFCDGVRSRSEPPVSAQEEAESFTRVRAELLKKAQTMDNFWNSLASMEDKEKFVVVFGLAAKEALAKCGRSAEWDQWKKPLVMTALEAWKSTLFVQVLRPRAAMKQEA
jgi:hypothetical protein